MPFSIRTKDGIIINNIPDNLAADSVEVRVRVDEERAKRDGTDQATIAAERPQPTLEQIRGGVELLGSLGTMILAEPVAGITGLATSLIPGAAPGAGAGVVKGVQERLTVDPGEAGKRFGTDILKGLIEVIPESVKQLGGDAIELFKQAQETTLTKFGPLAATALTVAPVAVLEIIPGALALKKVRNLKITPADEIVEEVGDKLREEGIESIKSGPPPEVKDYAEIAQDLRKQKTESVAEQVLPDEEILASAERLGVDLNPSHYSTSRAFIDVENSVKSRPGSKLAAIEEQAIIKTGEQADNLIIDLRGSTDKSLLDADIKADFDTNLAALDAQAQKAYEAVDSAIPAATEVNPTASRAYITRQLNDLGGDASLLTTAEKQLVRLRATDSHLTYSAIDRIRKDVGSALGKKSGPFKDDDAGVLKQLYKVLSEDQQGVADAFNVGADYAAARKLVSTRKALEAEAIALFGRDIGGSIVPKITQAATALTKGDTSKFSKLMNTLPKARRQEVAATMLNDIFTQGARIKGSISQGFAKSFASLNKNKVAKKILFDQLPAGAEKRFNDIGRVATGIFKSKALENNSKTARDILAALEEGGLISKLYDQGVRVAKPFAGVTVGGIDAAVRKVKTPGTEAADALLTSPAFKQSVEAAALDSLDKSQEIIKTSVFKKWLSTQPTNIKAEISAIGFIPFLTKRPEDEQ